MLSQRLNGEDATITDTNVCEPIKNEQDRNLKSRLGSLSESVIAIVDMNLTEKERQAMDAKRRCFIALKQVAGNAIADGLADHFDDALVDFVGTARFIDKRLGTDESIRRIAAILHK